MSKIPAINEEANKENIKIFKRYNIFQSGVKRHTCVLCGKRTSIQESVSNNGSKLICQSCYHKYFENFTEYCKWSDEDDI